MTTDTITGAAAYGTDEWCLDGAQSARLAVGLQCLIQDVYNTLRTDPGKLKGSRMAGKVGAGLRDFVGSVGLARAAAAIPSRISSALLADDRIAKVAVKVEPREDSPGSGIFALGVTVLVTPRGPGQGFALTLDVSEGALALIGVTV